MPVWNVEQLKHVADILMAAAHADGDVQKSEGTAVREIVTGLAGMAALPQELEARVRGFDPAGFDLGRAVAAITLSGADDRRALLKLVAQVTESDEVHDLDESDYIVRVARAIGASPEEYAGLTIALVEADGPPPVPTASARPKAH